MYDTTDFHNLFEQFQFPKDITPHSWLVKSERLTPDSEAYMVLKPSEHADTYYVLYAEDFIQSLEYVQNVIEDWAAGKVLKFLKPKKPTTFEDSPGSQFYTKPNKEDIAKWMPYAVPDRGQFVFVAQVEPGEENNSYWVESRRNPKRIEDLPPEVQEKVKELTKERIPVDPNKSFLETWQDKQSIN